MTGKELKEFFESRGVVLFDAAMGTALIAAGMPAGAHTEEMNLIAPETVLRIHIENIEAGSDVITGNTFGVSQMLFQGEKDKAIRALREGMSLAKRAASEGAREGKSILACLDIGPTGKLLGPFGEAGYEEAEEVFAAQAEAGARSGADFVLLETFADSEEYLCAACAAVKASALPVLGTMTFEESGRSFMGAAPADFVRAARAEGVLAVGANCTLEPAGMAPVIKEILAAADGLPVIAQPNAGQPVYKDGRISFEMTTDTFAAGAGKLLDLGISAIGGCCGTTPAMISAIRGIIDGR